jgi:hypothetical protein
MAEWSIASDLKSDELQRFREFESHSLLLNGKTFFSNQILEKEKNLYQNFKISIIIMSLWKNF